MSSDRLRTDPDLADVRRRINSFPSVEADAARRQVLLTELLVDLLRRPETTSEFFRLIGEGRPYDYALKFGAQLPYGVFQAGNREIGLVAEELGTAIVAQGFGEVFADEEIVRLATGSQTDETIDINHDPAGYYRQQAAEDAQATIGWAALRAHLRTIDEILLAGPIAEDRIRLSTSSALDYRARASSADMSRALPSFSAIELGDNANLVFRFRLSSDGASNSLIVEIHDPGAPARAFHATGSERAEVSLSQVAGIQVLEAMGLNPLQAGALISDGRGPAGFALVVDEIEGRLRAGAEYVDVSGAKLAAWITSCNDAFPDVAIAGYNTQPLPQLSARDLVPSARGLAS